MAVLSYPIKFIRTSLIDAKVRVSLQTANQKYLFTNKREKETQTETLRIYHRFYLAANVQFRNLSPSLLKNCPLPPQTAISADDPVPTSKQTE
ncbi:hypothetical protein CEXT_640291 [Caerostris extrusa]|uniref:Uncharacterized protein n=1 Tax=Caerostris extrusa TaxID=172846 RepID=A0AAV4QRJ1_CAEEX|nr:hypothetical protein CEXT_640291 [Caerostris extrusa]